MAPLRRFLLRLYNLLSSGGAEREMERELTAHLSLIEEECQRNGMTPDQAHFAVVSVTPGVRERTLD